MASVSPIECSICNEDFDEDTNCPRILPCSHHFCSRCIDSLIRNNTRQCPHCSENFQANSSKDVIINRAVLECKKHLECMESKATDGISIQDVLKQNAKKSVKEVSQLPEQLISDTEDTLKAVDNMITQIDSQSTMINEISSKLAVLEDGNTRTKRELMEEKNKITTSYKEIKENVENLKTIESKLDGAKAITEMGSLIEKVESLRVSNEDKNKALDSSLNTVKDTQKELKANQEALVVLQDTTRSMKIKPISKVTKLMEFMNVRNTKEENQLDNEMELKDPHADLTLSNRTSCFLSIFFTYYVTICIPWPLSQLVLNFAVFLLIGQRMITQIIPEDLTLFIRISCFISIIFTYYVTICIQWTVIQLVLLAVLPFSCREIITEIIPKDLTLSNKISCFLSIFFIYYATICIQWPSIQLVLLVVLPVFGLIMLLAITRKDFTFYNLILCLCGMVFISYVKICILFSLSWSVILAFGIVSGTFLGSVYYTTFFHNCRINYEYVQI